MQINHGVEWALHALVLLSGLPSDDTLGAARIAEFHGVPKDYMAKQMQALSRAGLVKTLRGRSGGYSLAKPATKISLLDVLVAIDGPGPAFRCREIRQNGPCPTPDALCKTPCPIAAAMLKAEAAYREALSATTIGDLAVQIARETSPERVMEIMGWLKP